MQAYIAALAECGSLGEVGALFARSVAQYGYTVSACGAFLAARTGPMPFFFFQHWPEDWTRLYAERNFVAVDFGVAEARRRLAPFTWLEARAERTLSRAESELWEAARRWGWSDGLSVPIHGPGDYFAIVTMGGSVPTPDPALRAHLHMLAFLTHERCRAVAGLDLVLADLGQPPSNRELECLRWVAAGKTDWEIAQILALSETTVRTHIDQARSKLGARTRAQAVARMILAGLG